MLGWQKAELMVLPIEMEFYVIDEEYSNDDDNLFSNSEEGG